MTTKHYSFEAANGAVTIDVVGEYRDGKPGTSDLGYFDVMEVQAQ